LALKGIDAKGLMRNSKFNQRVIPATAGIQDFFDLWMPACAGMTTLMSGDYL